MSRSGPILPGSGTSPLHSDGWSPRVIVVVVVALGLISTCLVSFVSQRNARRASHDDFDRIANEAALRLEGRMHGYEEALHASAGFVMGSDFVSAAEWSRFEETLRIHQLLPGASGMGYAGRRPGQVPESGGFGFIARDQEPATAEILGLPGAARAIGEACRTGEVTSLLPEGEPEPAPEAVLLRAVYGWPPEFERGGGCSDSLAGLVLLRFRPAELTQSLRPDSHPAAHFYLLTRDSTGAQTSLSGDDQTSARQVRIIPFGFAGRAWALEARSLPQFDRLHLRRTPTVLFLAGIIITGLTAALAGSEAHRRRLTRRAVSSMRQTLEQTTSELGHTEDRLSGLLDTAMDAILSLDHQARIRLMNPAAERMLRCRSSQVAGQPVNRFFPPRMRQTYRRELAAFGSGARQRTIGVAEPALACRFDGEEFPIEASISLAEIGGQSSYTVILRDVSDRQATELERRGLEAQLRQSQKMEAIGTLAGGIAHDFNNILGSILGNAELAEQDLPADHSAREFVSEITRAGERARDLVRRILSFTRQQDQVREPTRLEQVVHEVGQMLRASLPARIELAVEVEPDIPPVLADASQMHQVLMNLITNSYQAIGDQPGLIRVSLRRLPAGSDTSLPVALVGRDCLDLSVADNGAGMGPGVMERMFDPFFTTKPVGQGTGLGLSVVHGIVLQHEGTIRASSTLGVGTTVHVLLPGLGEEPAALSTMESVTPLGQGERVLLVDDEEALLVMNDRILRRLGYSPVIANGPVHALALAEDPAQQLDLVLTDFSMPGMSGIELADRLLRIRPQLPIILLTGYGLASSPEELRVKGIRAVLPKPVTIRALAQTLAAAYPVHA